MNQPIINQSAETWAIVELMGHAVIAGRWTDHHGMIRIDVPKLDGAPGFEFSKIYSPAAIYCITPVDESAARVAAARLKMTAMTVWSLKVEFDRIAAAVQGAQGFTVWSIEAGGAGSAQGVDPHMVKCDSCGRAFPVDILNYTAKGRIYCGDCWDPDPVPADANFDAEDWVDDGSEDARDYGLEGAVEDMIEPEEIDPEELYDYEADDHNFDAAREDAAFGRGKSRD